MDISRYVCRRYFTGLLQYFPKKRAILVQKLGEEKKSVFGYFMTKRNPTFIKLGGGGGKALIALPLRK